MNRGYIAVVHRNPESAYVAEFPDLPVRSVTENTVEEALHRAQCALNRFARRRRLPRPRPWHEMVAVATRRGAVAALCLLPRRS